MLVASLDHDAGWLVCRPCIEHVLEEACCTREVAAAIGRKAALMEGHPGREHGSVFGDAEQFVDRDAAGPAIDRQTVEFAHEYAIAGKAAGFLADDDVGAIFLVGAFEPAGDI